MIDQQEATNIMAAALDARGISYSPNEAEAKALGREYVPPPAPAPAPAAAPAPKAQSPEEMYAALTAPSENLSAVADEAMRPPEAGAADDYALPDLPAQPTPEQQATLAIARDAMREVGLPAPIGKWLAAAVNDGLKAPLNDLQATHARDAGLTRLRASWGAEFDANLATVRGEITRISSKNPQVVEWLERSGMANSPILARHVLNAVKARAA